MDYSTLLIVKGLPSQNLDTSERALQVYQEAINVADKAPAKYNNQKHYNKALTYFLIILSHERDQEDPLSKKN